MSGFFSESVWRTIKIYFFAALLLTVSLTALSPYALDEPSIAIATAIDLVLTVPVAYYFLIRGSSIPTITVVPVLIASIMLASFIVPDAGQTVVKVAIFIVPALEFFVFVALLRRASKIVGRYRSGHKEAGLDVVERLRYALSSEIRPTALGRAIAFEATAIFVAVASWRRETAGRVFRTIESRLPS